MIDFSPSSIRIGLIMILGTFWFVLLMDTIFYNEEEENK